MDNYDAPCNTDATPWPRYDLPGWSVATGHAVYIGERYVLQPENPRETWEVVRFDGNYAVAILARGDREHGIMVDKLLPRYRA